MIDPLKFTASITMYVDRIADGKIKTIVDITCEDEVVQRLITNDDKFATDTIIAAFCSGMAGVITQSAKRGIGTKEELYKKICEILSAYAEDVKSSDSYAFKRPEAN